MHIEQFEQFMIDLARSHLCQGIICGHIHHPVHRNEGSLEYLNCGDWVEHQSLVVETQDGSLRLIRNLDFA
jgi:UDP-2,3-diacylglucosamine pyrophosphatase LpxH